MSISTLPEWALKVKELYETGATDVEVMAEMKWSKADFDKYMETAGFAKLVEMGRLMSKAWWVGQVRKNLNNRQFNGAIYALYMKNNFGWAEKQETTESKSPDMMSSDEIKAAYERLAPEIAKTLKADGMTGAKVVEMTRAK